MKQATLCLLLKDNQILLAMKKRGFGAGRWNGAGGKVKEGEEIIDAAIRETKEEVGVEIKDPEKFGLLNFKFVNNPEWDLEVTLFIVKEWQGKPTESEEMSPQWFDIDKIPYSQMWPDDLYWLPIVLDGKKFEASFSFGENDKILSHNIQII